VQAGSGGRTSLHRWVPGPGHRGWVCRETWPAWLVPETQPRGLVPENQLAAAGSCLRPSLCWLVLQWSVTFHYKWRRRPIDVGRGIVESASAGCKMPGTPAVLLHARLKLKIHRGGGAPPRVCPSTTVATSDPS
jgi:hypothetical protein